MIKNTGHTGAGGRLRTHFCQKHSFFINLIICSKVFPIWFKHIYLAKHRTISTITTFVSVRGFERKLQVAYRVHLLNAWYIVIFMADN